MLIKDIFLAKPSNKMTHPSSMNHCFLGLGPRNEYLIQRQLHGIWIDGLSDNAASVNFLWEQEWKDELLTWDPNDFSGLKVLRMPCERIWLPDIVLYNK